MCDVSSPLHLRISIQLIEIAHPQRQIGIGKEFDSLGLGKPHEKRWDVFLDSTLLQQSSEATGRLVQTLVTLLGDLR